MNIRLINKTFIFTMIFLTIFGVFDFETANAAKSETVITKNGTYNGTMEWEEKKEYTYPQSWIGTFPSTYNYDKDGYTGTLQAKKIILTPLEKVYHKDAVYRTETREFTKTHTGTYSSNSNSNLPSTYYVNEDGYKGDIPRVSTSWKTNYNTGRYTYLTRYWTDSTYRVRKSDAPVPSTNKGTYYDSGSGKDVSYSLPKDGTHYSIDTAKTYVYSTSYGRAENYDRVNNSTLGYMSANTTTYYGGAYRYNQAPRPPNDYYGPDGGEFGSTGWTLVDIGWDECCVRDAKASQWHYKTSADGYMWRSDAGNLNRYRKGVYLQYRKQVDGHKYRQKYYGKVDLPDTVKDYTGTGTYRGTLSKEVFDHWNEYYTASKWQIEVVYEGTVYSTNLQAVSIEILDLNNNPQSYLIKGQRYKAKMTIKNNGDLDVGAFKTGLYEQGTLLGRNDISSLNSGSSTTIYREFVAQNTGSRTFTLQVDDTNVIKETTKSDNSVSTTKPVYINNLKGVSIQILDSNNNEPTYLIKGHEYTARMVIENNGDLNIGAFKVGFYEAGTRKTQLDVSSLNKGARTTLNYKFTATTTGNRTFMVKADDNDVIIESDKTDNTASTSKNVYINNLKAVSIQILDQNNNEPPYLIKGKQYKAKMVIQNNGDLNIGAFKVGFYEQGTRKTQLDVSSLNKGASVTLYADFTATTTGNRTFMVNADDTNIIQESDKTDNKASTNKMVYINNLKAINIRILELDGTEPSHLVKNRRYKAEMVIQNDGELDVGAFKVGLYEQGSLKGRNDVTSLKKGQTTTIYQEFIAATPGQRTFKMVVDDTNVIEETDETDNTASTTILVNTPPTFTMRYDPADVYEGDDVSVCINPNDEDNDPMTVILEMSKDGAPYQVVLNNSGVNSGEVQCYDISFIEQGNYRFRATVSDGYDSNSGTISFEAKQLIIIGRVLHTPQWTLQHERLGNEPHQFYSGEEFVLESDITNYPANYVKVFFQGEQVNGNMLNLTTNLTQQSNVLYTGSLYDQSMSRASTQLKNGTVTFMFEVEYTNGMIKRDSVDVEIIGSVFSAFNFHRRY